MRIFWILALTGALHLGGCAGLNQFPEVSPDYKEALGKLDKDYETVLAQIYDAAKTDSQRKLIRNEFIERRMAVIDVHFREFETALAKGSARVDFGVALVGVGVGGAGALVSETASQILSAVSGGLAGAQAAYSKSVLYDQASSALLAQMHAGRKSIAVLIFQQWSLDIDDYPLWRARRDIEAYYFAGSIPGAIVATAADAKVKEQEATKILLRKIPSEAVTEAMFASRAGLGRTIDGLDAAKAKALVTKIETDFPNIKPFINLQYPASVRAADATGDKAKTLLKRAMVLTVRNQDDATKWQAAILGL